MRILVTGGAGFIASHIVDAYISVGNRVVVIDNLSSGKKQFINNKAKFYQIDIRNETAVKEIINKEKPEIINHHAAQISVRSSVEEPMNDLEINLFGLLNLIESSKRIGLKKFIFASSGGVVYGEAKILPTSEDYHPLTPLSPYGVTKLTSELYLQYYYQTSNIPYVALRYGNVYGPRQNPHGEAGVVAIFAKKMLKGETPTINGDGKQTRDYVYIKDVVRANSSALQARGSGSLNIGTGIQTNVIAIFKHLQGILKTNLKVKYGPAKIGEQRNSCLDCQMAQRVLGWNAKVDLKNGLKETVEYFQQYEKD
ncbi:NAD-dependent epimerase/dehydratase family protein [Candidatus Gottesmanbacteria bacterium]|nr:NAD-dependent epimerase/dehydratase family protein [Candidatus Gottesmanbacteria bacterium]